jgi:hypothetical protein
MTLGSTQESYKTRLKSFAATNVLAYSTGGLCYKNILTIVSDACITYVSLVFALALASVVNYARKWCHSLERHLLTTLESSFMIIKCL